MARDFWLSSGFHLLERAAGGELAVTPAFLSAYLARPEMAPVEESCNGEIALHEELSADPLAGIDDERISALADEDAQDNYRVFLRFRDLLARHATLEAAYMAVVRGRESPVPALFLDQLVHAILRSILDGCGDPMRLRAAEILFRDQRVTTDEGRVMLADEEMVEMFARTGGFGGLGQLLAQAGTAPRAVELDVLNEDNKTLYWERSDRFDTVVDFRFTQPALDAFARVLESWIGHFLRLAVRIQPMQRIDDDKWRWHIGLDAEASRILNTLYVGESLGEADMEQIIALFRMEVRDREALKQEMRGRPIYLGLAKTRSGTVKMKPQNLLVNMPLAGEA